MKKNYKINRNYKPPSSEDITKHKDFSALLEKFEAQAETPAQRVAPRIRLIPWVGIALAAALTAWFFLVNPEVTLEEYKSLNKSHFASLPYINPPFADVSAAQFVSTKINASEGGVYEHATGSRIVFPEAAFVDDKGALIEGEVDIRYREFHDYVDFFLSGIPMTYDSAGVTYTLESAGMIEVYAEQDGKKVRMAPGKSLDIELISKVNMSPGLTIPPNYNIYRLDEEKRNWIFTDIDKMNLLDGFDQESENAPFSEAELKYREELLKIDAFERAELSKIEARYPSPTQPVQPRVSNGTDSVFDLDFSDNAEMAALYKNSLWQFSPRSAVQASEVMKNVESAELKKLNDREYEITFRAGTKTQVVIVNPVLAGEDYDRAMEEYERKSSAYQIAIKEREEKTAPEKETLRRQIEEQKRTAAQNLAEAVDKINVNQGNEKAAVSTLRKGVLNRFKATEFGIWNCDRPLPPSPQALTVDFSTEKISSLEGQTVFFVDQSRNTVHRFLSTDDTYLSFNRNSRNLMWVVTETGTIAVFRPEDFQSIPENIESFTIKFRDTGKKIKNEEDVREVLYL